MKKRYSEEGKYVYDKQCKDCGRWIQFHRHQRLSQNQVAHIDKVSPWYCALCRENRMKHRVNSRERHEERYIDNGGYVWVRLLKRRPDLGGNYIPEHRLVMEQKLGRRLARGETVHHTDGNSQNNAPENLELILRKAHPTGVRAVDLVCPHCGKPYSWT